MKTKQPKGVRMWAVKCRGGFIRGFDVELSAMRYRNTLLARATIVCGKFIPDKRKAKKPRANH